MFLVGDLSPMSLCREVLRFMVELPCIRMFSDLIFSPMHRLAHHRLVYSKSHKVHHEYTNKITSLVFYHGTYLDDFLMAVTTTFGAFLYVWLSSCVGCQMSANSNMVELLMAFNTLFSHPHDVRCASLIVPVPNALNFAAYHRVHHIHHGSNFGLTLPSDLVWDALLGCKTIWNPAPIDAWLQLVLFFILLLLLVVLLLFAVGLFILFLF
ncbi:unnamed protein product [Polarella glacialis]|uniref:Fatty acid hydroxylase domain-containing protein n=1 Tax=Polarella glacialis TaxID=89957 RepID=A0A813EVX9_POLGL|nr:unnamed protein product [Polarella glacialis]